MILRGTATPGSRPPILPGSRPPIVPARRPPMLHRLAVNLPVAVVLAAIMLWSLGVVQTLRVSSINMVPTLATGDHVMVRSYGAGPVLGDVIVYRSPFDWDHLQLGRVVAVGGDQVEMGEKGLHLDGRSVANPLSACPAYACPENALRVAAGLGRNCEAGDSGGGECGLTACGTEDCLLGAETLGDHTYFTRRAGALSSLMFASTLVPAGHVFVLSDNRVDERDSRIYGAIPHHAIVGVLSFVYYAFDETGIRWDRMSRPVS